MTRRLPQSTAYTVVFKVFLASDHVTPATTKTVAITLSKAGGAFGNPAAGASNATEISGGWYSFALGTGDTNTLGDLVLVGTATACDSADIVMMVVDPAVSIATGGITSTSFASGAITAFSLGSDAAIEIAMAVWDEDATPHQTAGTFGKAIGDPGAGANTIYGLVNTNLDVAVSAAGTLTSAERNSVADALLDRNMATGTDSGSPSVRTVRQALRFLRNKWTIAGGTLTVTKEDDTTSSWTAAITTTAGNPVSGSDPA